ncbi:MAG: CxxC-x17-CxxC domain-containing protein [Patescibacteria group bacterium]
MGNFNKFGKERDSRGFGGNRFGGGRKFGGRDRDDGSRQMYQATCAECGQACEVPFQPTGNRPVFCSNCFKRQDGPSPKFAPKNFGGGTGGGNFVGNTPSNNPGNTSVVSKAQFDSLVAKVDKILSILNQPKVVEMPKADVVEIKDNKKIISKGGAKAKKAKAKKK